MVKEKLIQALRQRSQREERGLFLAEGVRVAEELLAAGLPIEFAVASPTLEATPRGQELLERLGAAAPVERVSAAELRHLAATDAPQGVILVAHIPRVALDDLVLGPRALLLALDGVQDPGNLGTLVRSAVAFGAAAVLAMTGTVDPWNPKSVRAAAGTSFHLPVIAAETATALGWLKRQGVAIFAADMGGRSIETVERPDRVALVVGNEGAGVGEAVLAAADTVVAVPQTGPAESLNVGVAAGVLLYILSRGERANA